MMLGLFLRYILPALALAGVVSFGVNKYNDGIRKEAVAAALKDERAKTDPVFRELTSNFNALGAIFKEITEASKAERARQIAVVDLKDKELKYALTQNKTFKAELTRLHGDIAGFNSVLDTITANNNRATGASASTRLKQLGSAHTQCEKEYRAERVEHSETLGRLGEALAVVRALKN